MHSIFLMCPKNCICYGLCLKKRRNNYEIKKYFNYSPNGYSAFPGKRFVYPCKKNQVLFIYFLSNTTLPIWFVTTCIIIIYKTWKRWLKYQGREIKIFFRINYHYLTFKMVFCQQVSSHLFLHPLNFPQ